MDPSAKCPGCGWIYRPLSNFCGKCGMRRPAWSRRKLIGQPLNSIFRHPLRWGLFIIIFGLAGWLHNHSFLDAIAVDTPNFRVNYDATVLAAPLDPLAIITVTSTDD